MEIRIESDIQFQILDFKKFPIKVYTIKSVLELKMNARDCKDWAF